MAAQYLKKRLIVFVICISVVLPGLISEVITTNNDFSQGSQYQMNTLTEDDPIDDVITINTPVLISPPSGDRTNDRTVTLTWVDNPFANQYQVQVSTNSDFTALVVDEYTTEPTYTTPSLVDDYYYWHVREKELIFWSPYSTFRTFTVDNVPPAAPVLIAPENAIYTSDNTINFNWFLVTGAQDYQIKVDDIPTFTSPIISTIITSPRYGPTFALPDDIWFWEVRARDYAGNWGPWSDRYFIVDTTPPVAPVLVSPANGFMTNDVTPYFNWNPVSGANQYRLQVSTNTAFTSIAYETTTGGTGVTPSSLSPNTYFWHVQARDAALNWGPYCNYRVLTIDTTPPGVPTLNSPSDGYVSSDTTPMLSWTMVSGANLYQIQVSLSPTFSSTVYDQQTSGNAIIIPSALADNVYYWRVRARDAATNWGSWSTSKDFIIDTTDPVFDGVWCGPQTPNDADSVDIRCDVSDTNDLSEVRLYVRVNGGSWTNYAMSYVSDIRYLRNIGSFNFGDLVEYYVTATDNAAPTANVAIDDNSGLYYNFTVASSDYDGPSVSLVNHNPETPDDTDTVTISCNADDFNGIQSVTLHYSVNDGGFIEVPMFNIVGPIYSINIGSFAYGDTIEYVIVAVDDSPNHNTRIEDNAGANYSFTVISSDNTGPEITDIQNEPVNPNDVQTVNITCSVTDPNGIEGVTLHYRVDSSAWVNVSMSLLSGDIYSVVIGAFSYNEFIEYFISATDNYVLHNLAVEDNSGSYYSFTITSGDLTGPTITSLAHYPSSPTDITIVKIGCVVTDANGVQSVILYYRINGGSWIFVPMTLTTSDTYNFTIGYFAYGSVIEYYITAEDNSPNHNEVTDNNGGLYYSFTVGPGDVSGPVFGNVVYDPVHVTEIDLVNITCLIFDVNGVQNATLHYRVDYGTWNNVSMALVSGSTYGAIIGTFNYGEYIQFYFSAFDDYVLHNLGIENYSGLFFGFSIFCSDQTAPEISNISHSPTTPDENDLVTVSCDATDASGIQVVYLIFRIDGGTWMQRTMVHTTGDTYQFNIGTFDYLELIEYRLQASDNSFIHNTVFDDNDGLYYSFTIISSDTTDPTINTVEYDPTAPTELDSINVTCYAFDASGLLDVSLHYRINDGAWTIVDMTVLAGNFYNVTLNPFNVGDIVEFYITATDDSVANNVATDDNGGLYYSITITQYTVPTPIAYLIPIITVFSLIVLIRKRK